LAVERTPPTVEFSKLAWAKASSTRRQFAMSPRRRMAAQVEEEPMVGLDSRFDLDVGLGRGRVISCSNVIFLERN